MRRWSIGTEQTYIMELKETEFPEVGDGAVSRLDGNNQLDIRHLLGAHQIHGRQVIYEILHFLVNRNGEGEQPHSMEIILDQQFPRI